MNNLYFDGRMKRLIILLMIWAPALSFSQTGLPDYWTVVNKFFSLYHHENSIQENLDFAKKKDGWHVQLTNRLLGDSVISDQVFWSKQKGRYQVLERYVGADRESAEKKALAFIFQSNNFSFDGYKRFVYFGYPAWDIDIIKDYSGADIKNDTLLDALANAYSKNASRYLWYQYGNENITNDPLQERLGRLEMPGDERIKKVIECFENSTGNYQKILRNNKLYETTIGNIGLKLFNETFHAYVQLLFCNRPAEAKIFLDKCRLPVNDSIAAVNLLESVGTNGILFAYGDNDTYPSFYLQEKYGTRKDVAVLNVNYLGHSAYLELLKRRNTVNFSTTAAEYGRPDMDIAFFYGESPVVRKKPMQDFVAGYKNLRKVPSTGKDSVKVYDTQKLYMLIDGTTAKKPDSIVFDLQKYLPMNQVILMDIVSNNFLSRPIHFALQHPQYFDDYVRKMGLTWQLTSLRGKSTDITQLSVDQLTNFLSNKYKAPFINFTGYSHEYNYNANNHVSMYMALIRIKLAQNDKPTAEKLIDDCFAPFAQKMPYLLSLESILPVLYENAREELGDKLAKTFIETILEYDLTKKFPEYYDSSFAISQLQKLVPIFEKYQRNRSVLNDAISKVDRQ